jgi:hypothetical protein
VAYGRFFAALAERIATAGLPEEPDALAPFVAGAPDPPRQLWHAWRDAWWAMGRALPPEAQGRIGAVLRRWNLPVTPVRAEIERIWESIDQHDDWAPLNSWLASCGTSHGAGSGCSVLQPPPLASV